MRKKINRFLRRIEGKQIKVTSLLLPDQDNKESLLDALSEWERNHPAKNDPDRTEGNAIEQSLNYAKELELKNLVVYLDNKLVGFTIYHRPHQKKYFVMHHLRVSYDIPYISDFIYYELAKRAIDEGVVYINIEMDLGIESLRSHKLELRPVRTLKKFSIEPSL